MEHYTMPFQQLLQTALLREHRMSISGSYRSCLEGGTMTETVTRPEGVPVITADPFSVENLTEPHSLHEQLREAGPAVYLERYGVWGMGRYEQVNTALKDWKTYSSACGVGRR